MFIGVGQLQWGQILPNVTMEQTSLVKNVSRNLHEVKFGQNQVNKNLDEKKYGPGSPEQMSNLLALLFWFAWI